MDLSSRRRIGLHRRSRKRSPQRPPWKNYWKNDPAPDIISPNYHGPFRETALQCPLEARDQRGPYIGMLGVIILIVFHYFNVNLIKRKKNWENQK